MGTWTDACKCVRRSFGCQMRNPGDCPGPEPGTEPRRTSQEVDERGGGQVIAASALAAGVKIPRRLPREASLRVVRAGLVKSTCERGTQKGPRAATFAKMK